MKAPQKDMNSWVNTRGLQKAVLVMPNWKSDWEPMTKFSPIGDLNNTVFRIDKKMLLDKYLDRSNLILRPEEVDRSHKFKSKRARNKFLSGRIGLRLILGEITRRDPFTLRFSRNRWGKPALSNESLCFNVSHSEKWLLVAISAFQSIGADIENVNPLFDYRPIVKTYFHPSEQDNLKAALAFQQRKFFQLWTRKEALAKVIGLGLHERFLKINVMDEALPHPHLKSNSFFVIHSFNVDNQHLGAVTLRNSVQRPTFYSFL